MHLSKNGQNCQFSNLLKKNVKIRSPQFKTIPDTHFYSLYLLTRVNDKTGTSIRTYTNTINYKY